MTAVDLTEFRWMLDVQADLDKIEASDADPMVKLVLKHMVAVAAMGRRHAHEGQRYNTHAEMILDLAVEGVVAPLVLPPDVQLGALNMCFANAMALAERRPDEFLYHEGEAYPENSLVPTAHAWVVRRSTGEVVDPTWSNPEVAHRSPRAAYVGIPFDIDFVIARADETGHCSVIGSDWMVDDRAVFYGLVTDDDGVVVGEGEP